MTVVAALRIETVPVLFGDFIISSPVGRDAPMWIPTNPNAKRRSTPDYQISGLRKKIQLCHPELCVGWSGSAMVASIAIRKIEEAVSKAVPSWELLRTALAKIDYYRTEENNVELVGWLGPYQHEKCFKWASKHPDRLEAEDGFIIGFGSDVLAQILSAPTGQYSDAVDSNFDKCVLKVLTKLSGFLGNEITVGQTLENFCGYGLEILVSEKKVFNTLMNFHSCTSTF